MTVGMTVSVAVRRLRWFAARFVTGLVLAAVTLASSGSHSQAAGSKSRSPIDVPASVLEARLPQLLNESQAPGAIAGVVVHGGSATVVATGTDPHTHAALSTGDAFRVASITKTFVGALALRLVQHRQLRLDDPVTKYVPDWPRGSEITVGMLLAHTSGLAPWGSDRGSPGPYSAAADQFTIAHYGKTVSPDEVLAFVRDRPVLFTPGKATSYSNINTILLGQIITAITGRNLGVELHRELLDPLGLTETRYAPTEPSAPIAGLSDLNGNGTILDTGLADWTAETSIEGAAGGTVSTIPDLLRWADAFLRDRSVVKDPLATDAFRIRPGGTGLGVLGFSTTRFFCVFADNGCPRGTTFRAFGGAGAFNGARSILAYDPQTDAVVAVVVNRDGTPGIEEFVRDVFAIVLRIEKGHRPASKS